jgi:iron complex transport system substrate-binding protein
MKILLVPVLLNLTLVIAACGNAEKKDDAASVSKNETITYKSENGNIKVPAHPKRVVVLAGFAGNVMALGLPVVGVDSWSTATPKFDKLKDVTKVSE